MTNSDIKVSGPAFRRSAAVVSRRHLLRVGAGLGVAAAGTAVIAAGASASEPTNQTVAEDPATRKVILVGANPGITLFDGDTVTAYASLWRVDWSDHGSGTAIVTWHDGRVDLFTDAPVLGQWLESHFTRHFPEVAGLPWPEPVLHRVRATVDIDLDDGVRAHAGELRVHISGILQRRAFATDEFPLGDGGEHSLSLVTAPSEHAWIARRGRRLPGDVELGGTPERPSSSAFIAVAEVWRR